ncbi:branched-chain amino acid ABC transporter permease [Nonomuraea roseoviolacea]|uniref:Branched-chain amino acid transport system permease protein n=1 Tax=Nonomuraea roseoviolacea subsp. carminata TaxID=160689 RepID=A0ABT1JW68_9ACTN|nr:branched-chain amino acid ABC transporter permease [Nonomuraea roseoviolacea]MCP2345642.1 branched-chain amino acid transport system permease protein [Nonomuraea roseoviolacea subsp. carminata]
MRLRPALSLALLVAVLVGAAPTAVATASIAGRTTLATRGDDPETVKVTGKLVNRDDTGSTPVGGGRVTVTDASGAEHVATSRPDGGFSVEVPFEAGPISIKLDEGSLPRGVTLREGSRNPITRTISGTLPLTVTFVLGKGDRRTMSWADQVPQSLFNGLYFGLIISLGALGLSLIFGTTRLTNFAHGEMVTFGALVTYGLNVAGIDIWPAGLLAALLAAVFGFAQDRFFWRPIRRRGTGVLAMMIISIGVQFILRNVYQFFTGGRTETYRQYTTPEGHQLGPITYSVRDVVCVAIALVLVLGVTIALKRTRLGRATRAVADNAALAATTGIDVNRVITTVWAVGALLAATCGMLLGFSQAVKFDLGALQLLVMFAAITVGGLGSVWGAVLGSLLVGTLIEMSTLVIPSELKMAAALFLLVGVLLFRPQGLLGRAQRIG